MIHKYLAGLIDQYQLAGDPLALDVAARLGDWVDWRTARLPYAQMQMVLQNEFGGLPEALANLYTITGPERYLAAAQRFYHAEVLDPLADGIDELAGLQANVTTPKIIACVRMWEETGSGKYRDIAQNFWDIVTGHHVYVIGGAGNYEHFQARRGGQPAVQLHLRELRRLQPAQADQAAAFPPADPDRPDRLLRATLFNQMLGEQDPASPHGFNCYYTGLSAGAFKRQPLNYFPGGNPGSTPPTTTPSPATPPPGWKRRPSSPTPSTPATRTACTSTCSSPRGSASPGSCCSRPPGSPTIR